MEKDVTLRLETPEAIHPRDLSKFFAAVSGLYGYFVLLTDPEVQKDLREWLDRTLVEEKQRILYPSSMEALLSPVKTIKVTAISTNSPVQVTLRGSAPAMDALENLFLMFVPLSLAIADMRQRVRDFEIDTLKDDLGLSQRDSDVLFPQETAFQQHQKIVAKADKLPLSRELKKYVVHSLLRGIRSVELSDLVPSLVQQ